MERKSVRRRHEIVVLCEKIKASVCEVEALLNAELAVGGNKYRVGRRDKEEIELLQIWRN